MSTAGTDIAIYYPESGISESFGIDTIGFTIAALCPCAVTLAGEGVDSTHVRVTFSAPVLDNPAIRCADLWVINMPPSSGPVAVLEVTPEQNPVASVLLTTSEHKSLPDYEVLLYILEIA